MSLKNGRGYSIAELMIAMGILGGISLVAAKIMSDQATNDAFLRTQTEVGKAVALIGTNINNETKCKEMFAGTHINTNGSNLPELKTATQSLLISSTDYGKFSTGLINLKNSGQANLYNLSIEFFFRPSNSSSANYKINKILPVYLTLDSASNVLSCRSDLSQVNDDAAMKMCNSLGTNIAVWNSALKKCVLKELKCSDPNEVPLRLDANGSLICTPITSQIDLDDIVDTTPKTCTGNTKFQIVEVGGKISITCSGGSTTGGSTTGGSTTGGSTTGGSTTGGSTGCTPVNGSWGTTYDFCTICTSGQQTCTAACDSPAPSCGGAACSGPAPTVTLSCGSTGTTSGGGTSGGCFVAGSRVTMADGSYKNIEDVLKGESLKDGTGKIAQVMNVLPKDYAGDVYSVNGSGYFFTPNHPFLTVEGWKAIDPVAAELETPKLGVRKLGVGDILVKESELEMIYSLDSIPISGKVYNFSLNGNHEYLVEDYRVHNKCMPPSCDVGENLYICWPCCHYCGP